MPVNVLHISPCSNLGGARNSLLTLVKAMKSDRYCPIVASPPDGPLVDELKMAGIRWVPIEIEPFRKGRYLLSLPSQIRSIREAVEKNGIGLVHCNEHFSVPHALCALDPAGTMAGLWKYLRGDEVPTRTTLPLVAHMRVSVPARHIRNYRLAHVHRLVGVSKFASSEFDDCLWSADRVRTVYNAVQPEIFEQALGDRAQIRSRLGLDDTHVLIGMIGVISPRKRNREAMEIFRLVHRQCPQARFLLVGSPRHGSDAYAKEVNDYIGEHGLSDVVQVLPWQNSPAPYFAALDLHVFLSSVEGFGRVVIEAAVCRVPTLASNISPNHETIVPGETGWIVGTPNADEQTFRQELQSVADRVADLIHAPALLKDAGEKARRRALTCFSPQSHAEEMSAVFDEAIACFRSGIELRG